MPRSHPLGLRRGGRCSGRITKSLRPASRQRRVVPAEHPRLSRRRIRIVPSLVVALLARLDVSNPPKRCPTKAPSRPERTHTQTHTHAHTCRQGGRSKSVGIHVPPPSPHPAGICLAPGVIRGIARPLLTIYLSPIAPAPLRCDTQGQSCKRCGRWHTTAPNVGTPLQHWASMRTTSSSHL